MSAMSITAKRVEELLKKDGWPCQRGDDHTWRSAFKSDASSFTFYVRMTEDWIFFSIVPYVTTPKGEREALALYRHLLKLNRDMNLAKFALDEDGDVALSVELPTENLDDSEFKDALEALSFYADRHYLDVSKLA
jgi:hypothetical protein